MCRLKRFHMLLGLTSSRPELAVTFDLHCDYPRQNQTHHHDSLWLTARLGQEDDGISYSHGRVPWAAAGWTAAALADTLGLEARGPARVVTKGTRSVPAETKDYTAHLAAAVGRLP